MFLYYTFEFKYYYDKTVIIRIKYNTTLIKFKKGELNKEQR